MSLMPCLYRCPTHSADTYYDGEIDYVAECGCLYSCTTHSADTYYDGDIDFVVECGCHSCPVSTDVLHIVLILTMMVR